MTTAESTGPTLTPASRCSTRDCNRTATVWMYGPDEKRVPGSWCRPCAERASNEYRDKLGETWPVRDAPMHVDKWYVVIADGHHYGYPTVEGAAGDIIRNQTSEATPQVRIRLNGRSELRDLTPLERHYLDDAIKEGRKNGEETRACSA